MSNPTMSFRTRLRQRLARLGAGLLATLAIASVARAQSESSAPPPVDPPARVGRISLISGPVTMVDYRANEESDATLNWPVTSQQRLSTGGLGRVEVRIGSTSVRLDGDSVLDFNRVDDEIVQMTLQRGSVAVRVRNREQLREIDLLTPRERVSFEDVGRYRVDVDRTPGITAVTANVGSARIINGRTSFVVQSGQRGEATAEPAAGFQVVAPAPDNFDDWVASRDRRDDTIQSTRYVSAEATGVESLDEHGEWRTVETYGTVWFPTGVVAGWAPYRYGHWAYVWPWGWTWIDDAPWGFTPFHYGRWVYVGRAWGWVPGAYVARPCYAPALVGWYGSPGVSVSVGVGSIGWFPLAPNEAFIPNYRYSHRYITQVNYGPVNNITNITVINPPTHYRWRQPGTSTWAPEDAIVHRTPINRVVRPAPNDWAKIPAQPHPPMKVTEDLRRIRPNLVAVPAPEGSRAVTPPRQIAPRPGNEGARADAPVRTPPSREMPGERDSRRDLGNRSPAARPGITETPNPAPTPRVVAPRPETPRADVPRSDAPPRRDAARGEPQPVRPPKAIERAPIERAPVERSPVDRTPAPRAGQGQVGAPTQQIAPRPAPRPEAPPPVGAPRQAPAPRPEAPAHQGAPAQRGAESVPHAKPAQRSPEAQRN